MQNETGLFHKECVDRFIRERYEEISAKFRVLDKNLNEKGVSSLDKLNDTIINLYMCKEKFETYEEFRSWANNKFTPKESRKNIRRRED